ncbi:response regulator [Candidatus Magnetaquicoccus inordinatus]|uniref:response regulator n=1 Tax=Candidatus Magnetaquicoccus inordinatus TaxID=2496818 RepID=UPI00102AAFEF|nr:response regulator [Candidatus Magnetaquicoccus inordinatus]
MRALIVDDESMNRLLLAQILKPFAMCDQAMDGQEAIELFSAAWQEQQPYSVVLLDMMMPVLNGRETWRAIRRFEEQQALPAEQCCKVVLITALDLHHDEVNDLVKDPFARYLAKPVRKATLVSIFQEWALLS